MRIIDGLMYQLRIRDFVMLDIKMNGVYLFYRPVTLTAEIILAFHAPTGDELSEEEYVRFLAHIKDKFLANGFQEVHILSLIMTENPDRAKKYCLQQDEHWIMDLYDRRLIIYENQISDFMELKNDLEELLEKDNLTMDMQFYPDGHPENIERKEQK